MTPVALRVAEFRKAKGLTQAELAAAAKVRPATLSDIEAGATTRIDLEVLDRLANALGVDPALLFISVPAERCAVCRNDVFDRAKFPNRSLYKVACPWCGVYLIGGLSERRLVAQDFSDQQRAAISNQTQTANAEKRLQMVFGDAYPDENADLISMDAERVERFAFRYRRALLDCRRNPGSSGFGFGEQPARYNWLVTINGNEDYDSEIPWQNMTRGEALGAITAWYDRKFPAARRRAE